MASRTPDNQSFVGEGESTTGGGRLTPVSGGRDERADPRHRQQFLGEQSTTVARAKIRTFEVQHGTTSANPRNHDNDRVLRRHGSDGASSASVVTARSVDDGSDPGVFEAKEDLTGKCGQEHSSNNGKGKKQSGAGMCNEPHCAVGAQPPHKSGTLQ